MEKVWTKNGERKSMSSSLLSVYYVFCLSGSKTGIYVCVIVCNALLPTLKLSNYMYLLRFKIVITLMITIASPLLILWKNYNQIRLVQFHLHCSRIDIKFFNCSLGCIFRVLLFIKYFIQNEI